MRNVGKIETYSEIADGQGKRKAREFLDTLLKQFVKQSVKYISVTHEAPYAYKERQLHSIFAPALNSFTDAFLMEYPVDRKWSKLRNLKTSDSNGWVDYWCRYRGIDFLIEIKHDFINANSMKLRKRHIEKWNYMNNKQLRVIKDEARYFCDYTKGVFLLPIHAFTFYQISAKKSDPNLLVDTKRLDDIKGGTMMTLNNPKPNWCGVWQISSRLCDNSKYEIDSLQYEYYPAVAMVATVKELITINK